MDAAGFLDVSLEGCKLEFDSYCFSGIAYSDRLRLQARTISCFELTRVCVIVVSLLRLPMRGISFAGGDILARARPAKRLLRQSTP